MISTRGRYALRVMIDLAEHNTEDYISLKDIARRQKISEKYLESIVKALVIAGFLEGMRGKGGGYCLTRKPDEYSVYEILKAAEGSLASVACLDCDSDTVNCDRASDCRTLPMWQRYDEITEEYFSKIKVADFLEAALPENTDID